MEVETTRKVYIHANFEKAFSGVIRTVDEFANSVTKLLEKDKMIAIEKIVSTKHGIFKYSKHIVVDDRDAIDFSYLTIFNVISVPLRIIDTVLIAFMVMILTSNSINPATLLSMILAVDLVIYSNIFTKVKMDIDIMAMFLLYTGIVEYSVMNILLNYNIHPVIGYIIGAITAETIMKIIATIDYYVHKLVSSREEPQRM